MAGSGRCHRTYSLSPFRTKTYVSNYLYVKSGIGFCSVLVPPRGRTGGKSRGGLCPPHLFRSVKGSSVYTVFSSPAPGPSGEAGWSRLPLIQTRRSCEWGGDRCGRGAPVLEDSQSVDLPPLSQSRSLVLKYSGRTRPLTLRP